MVTSRDVEEIVSKLSSDRAKAREEGIKLLNTWLEGERSITFCQYIGRETAKLKPKEIPNSETWPFLVSLLVRCVSSEISTSKRRLPRLSFAKTLRIIIQRAEDVKFSGKVLPLLHVVRTLFGHVSDVLSTVPSFQWEYAVILRHLLSVRDYRFHLRNRVYCSLVRLYLEKVETGLDPENNCPKEEIFRYILTLHSLLENPPGDFPEVVRGCIVKGFVSVFSLVREEGKISRKLVECVNTYLLKDGPNLGSEHLEIHNAMQHFVFRFWTTTHDRGLKDALIYYAMLQLNLMRGDAADSSLVEQILDVVCKELDQASSSSSCVLWTDAAKDEKLGSLRGSHCRLVEIAALVLYRACSGMVRTPANEKRAKKDPVAAILKEALMKGRWLWHATFCYLVNKYFNRLSKDLFLYWFEGISTNFERILNDANMVHAYDGLLWTLRSLQELTTFFYIPDSQGMGASFITNEMNSGWQSVWNSLMHGLPLFSNSNIIVDAALMLLGSIVASDQTNSCIVSQELWDLNLFKRIPSESALYFIACYFSRRGSQGDLRDSLHVRKNLLQAVLSYFDWKESFLLNDRSVYLLPAAVYALSAGCSPSALCGREFAQSYFSADTSDATSWTDENECEKLCELFECSVEALTKMDANAEVEGCTSPQFQGVRLPRELRELLLHDMESYVLRALLDKEDGNRPLSEVLFICALLTNFVYGSSIARKREDVSGFLSRVGECLMQLLDNAVTSIGKNSEYLGSLGFSGSNSDSELKTALTASLRSFVCCPVFGKRRNEGALDTMLYASLIQSLERLLKALTNCYENYSEYLRDPISEFILPDSSMSGHPYEVSGQVDSNKRTIVDMELDVNEDIRDVRFLSAGGKTATGVSFSEVEWKMGMITLISSLVTVLGAVAWDALFELLRKECDYKVCEKMLYHLCRHPLSTSSLKIGDLVKLMNDMVEFRVNRKLDCNNVLTAIYLLLHTSSFEDSIRMDDNLPLGKREFEKNLVNLRELVTKVAETGLLGWLGRVRLIDCICHFVSLCPSISQTMIERLFLLLQDPDYRVRFYLAGKIGVLFQTWEGHEELFQDICSSLGVALVIPLKRKIVTAEEVLAAGPQPRPRMETAIITLMHLAFHSEKIELEAVFMMCAISAIDPSTRELVNTALDSLSRKLHYSTRFKYLEQLMASILFCWVSCGVSLVTLVEIRQLFVANAEPSYFIQYICQWLLPALILQGNNSSMRWVSQVACQPLAVLVKNHFVPIFAICMALLCSKESDSNKGALVLQSSILQIAGICETERDKLIKKHMVSIVGCILSITSCASDPAVPYFSKDTIVRAVQRVVDGFLELDDYTTAVAVVDKINVFRPDRVFMFVVEMHYKISEAVHHRHRCHKLAGLEVLVEVLGHRVAVASTSSYLLNMIGQYIACEGLVGQCCCLISALLKAFESSQSKEIFWVLGEQLQFLVSKLVESIIPSEVSGNFSGSKVSHVLPLLLRLTVDSDSSLHGYVQELEPFPGFDIFDGIRKFHLELCQSYSAREHLLKVVKRSSYVPPRLLLCSVHALHKKLLLSGSSCGERSEKDSPEDILWHQDPEAVQAVWALIRLCCSNDADSIKPLVSDFISKVGIGNPHHVVFHLPGDSAYTVVNRTITDDSRAEVGVEFDTGISEDLLIAVLRLLEKYLMDESVRIIDIASQALRGILSTEKGQRVLLSLNSFERSLIEVHSKGVNVELVEKLLLDLGRRSRAESVPLEEPKLWETCDKTFDAWICPLVYSLIGLSNDVILRLCSDIVLLKAEVAELLLPGVIVDLARKKHGDIDLCKLISSQVEEHILTVSNKLTKSIQVFLSALNELRICHVMERSSPASTKRESTKYVKPSSSGSKSHPPSFKVRDSDAISNGLLMPSTWEKVYWLTIDYLIVAKAAVICGSYFTTMMYVEHWCEEYFRELTLGNPDFFHIEVLPEHVEILMSAVTRINEPDSLYGIILSHKLTSQVVTYEHEGNWSKALEYYDLQVRSGSTMQRDGGSRLLLEHEHHKNCESHLVLANEMMRKPYKGLIRSLQHIGCTHVLDVYCEGLTSRNSQMQHDLEFCELQHEAAWRAGNWDFAVLPSVANFTTSHEPVQTNHFNENLHSCLRALHEGDFGEFHMKLRGSKQELLSSVSCASEESTEHIYSTVVKLQILSHLGSAWHLRWTTSHGGMEPYAQKQKTFLEPVVPTVVELSWLNADWRCIWNQAQLHMGLLEPFMAFRRVLLQILGCADYTSDHLLQSASTLRKGCRFSQAAAALQEFKSLCVRKEEQYSSSYWLGQLEEAKLLRAQGQCEIAISLAQFVSQNCQSAEETSDVHRLIGKWLAETRSSNSRTILEKHLKPALSLAGNSKSTDKKSVERQSKCHFLLAHYADALFKSYEDRLSSSEWQAALRLRKHKTFELEALMRRLKGSRKEEKEEYSIKIKELQKQLTMDKEEAEKMEDDKDNFLRIALEGYKRCLVIGDKYDVRVVFRLVSLWFSLSSRKDVVNNMLSTIDEVQSYKFVPLVYQIASRMGSTKDVLGPHNFQFALVSLVKKMAIDHPYHTIFQLLALANGDRIKDKQRSRNSFVVDMDKIISAKNLLEELSSYKGAIIKQMKHMVEIYIKLAELETRREDVSKRVALPREIRGIRQLELVPVVTASFPVDCDCCYPEGSFPYFKGVSDSVVVMNGINAPKVVECLGSDGKKYRQLAKSGNDDLRQDAVMEQFFGLVNTFLQKNRDTRRRGLGVRTYKVVPFTPSAGVLEWVSGTLPLGEYLIDSTRNGGAHGRYGLGDWSFPKCRERMSNEKDKRRAFQEVCKNFRPVMHHFFLERFLQPADWFEKRLAYTRSVATSSMVGYIVGLGDRHSMNILIDQATAEVVHIDLGVAFEQGLMLKTPERVPFRLTRDIIDGMGVTGVEGVFRRCSEETLSVMRTNKEALMTIVEVFIHDPLYKWALSPLKALQRQKETDDDLETNLEDPQEEHEGNKDAARALIRVKQKLDGYEEGELRSVHGQVQQLIQDAIDPERLCQMFPGWGAWL